MSQLEKLMRPHMAKIATYHGVDPSVELARQAGIKPEDVIRLNANENPYGAYEKVSEALMTLDLHLYPDTQQRILRAALSESALSHWFHAGDPTALDIDSEAVAELAAGRLRDSAVADTTRILAFKSSASLAVQIRHERQCTTYYSCRGPRARSDGCGARLMELKGRTS